MFLVKNLFSKTVFNFSFLVLSLILVSNINGFSQCDVNSPYDKIVSGYHQSIALKSDGSFAVWGQDLDNTGAGDVLSPITINVSNYPALTGTPLKATIGGQGSSGKEQAILLTTTGLFAWGTEGYVIDANITSSAAFQKITINSKSDGLPVGVNPNDVKMLVGSYKALAIVTNSGNVWVLNQLSANIQGNGQSLSINTWQQVLTAASTPLTNVTSIRLQSSSATLNALMALTSSGNVYVWGNSVYLNDGSTVTSKSYATQISLPAEFSSSNKPKMIGVTGGVKNVSTGTNTFYVLSNNGSLYALGANNEAQCGNFTTTEAKNWVNSQRINGTNFSNITSLSVQEHDASFPGVAVITSNGDLYTWGVNGGLMLGRTTSDAVYDPGMPLGFSSGYDKALYAELGGHTLVYLKEGTSQFCYVGHKVGGSMGDGTNTDTNISTFNCTGTPSLAICGAVPVAADLSKSTILANPTSIIANGTSTSTITIQLKNSSDVNLTTTGGTVVVTTTDGSLGTVSDNNDGTYTVILTSSNTVTTTTLGFSVNGTTATGTNSTTTVNFTPLSGSPSISTNGSLNNFSTCLTTSSVSQSFTVTASDLTADLTVTAPAGFQIASTEVGTYTNSLTFSATSGTVSATNIWVRLTGATAGTFTGTIDVSSAGATTQSISISGTVNAASVGGTISGSTTVIAPTNSNVLTLTGSTGSIQWQSSADNNTFNNITGATSATYTATNITATTYYKAVVTSGVCTAANSNVASITYSSSVLTSTITTTGSTSVFSSCLSTVSASQSFTVTASDLTADLTITAPAGFQISRTQVGTYTNSLTLTTTSGTVSATDIWVRLTGVTAGTFTGTLDASSAGATTKSVSVIGTVNASSIGGTISGSTSVCSGTNSTTLTLSGYTGNITKWQSSTSENFNTVIDIANTTNSLTATNLTTTSFYRAIVQSGSCTSANSNKVYIEVKSCVQENKIVANPDNNTTSVNIPVNGNVSTNDIISTEVKYGLPQALNTNPIGAIISLNTSSGTYTFTATKSGKYDYYVSICGDDNTINCQFSLLQITVLDPTISNNLPVAKVDIATTNLNTAVTTSVLTNDKSGNIGTVLVPSSVSIVTKPVNGAAVVNSDGTITYTPTNGFSGNDSLVYNVCDDATPANCQSTLVYYKILTAGAISTTSAIDDYAFINNNKTGTATVSGNVLKNDKNTSEANLIASLITGPTEIQGNLTLSADGSFKFIPALGFSGPADLVYNACSIDNPTICSKATLHIVVYPPPTINPDFNSTNVNITVTGNINTNDNIPAGTTYGTPFALENNPKGATIVLNTNTGTYSFTASKTGKYNFNIPVCAASQLSGCPISSLKITVLDPTKTNNPPVANDDYSVTQINKPVITSILSNDKPGNKNTLLIASSIVIDSSPKNGTASANKVTSSSSSNATIRAFSTNGTITYTPNPGFVGLDSLVYTVCDNANPANCEVAIVYYTISTATPNNVLVANDDYNTSLNLISATGNVLLNDDYGGAVLTASVVTGPTAAQGTFILSSDGAYSFTPAFGFTGPVDIIYQACSGSTCVNATLHILVDLVPPSPPTVINATYVAGSKSNPTNIKSLVTVTTTGTTLKWCDPTGTSCATTPPIIPNIPGTYIWCVKSVDTVTLLSSTCAMDTVIILAPYTVMEVTKTARAVQTNPDGSVLLTFILKASNKTNTLMDSVSVIDDLTQSFKVSTGFSIAALDVYGGLVKNSIYDGISNINLVTNQSKIAANSSDSAILKVLVASPNIFGSLTNTAILSGKTKYGYVSVNSNDPLANPSDTTKRLATGFNVPKADLIIAGGFSPNYDGLNDKWIIVRPFGTRVEVQVFNRWGNIVYQNADYKNDWNGMGTSNFMGQDVPDGTYFYIVNSIDPTGVIKKFTSSLTIVR